MHRKLDFPTPGTVFFSLGDASTQWLVWGPLSCSAFIPVIMTGNYLKARELQRSWKELKLGLFVPAEFITYKVQAARVRSSLCGLDFALLQDVGTSFKVALVRRHERALHLSLLHGDVELAAALSCSSREPPKVFREKGPLAQQGGTHLSP